MEKKNLLRVITATVDFELKILAVSKNRELLGKNLLDLFSIKELELLPRLSKMKQGAVHHFEAVLLLDLLPKRYSIIIRKGYFQYLVVIIEIENVYQLMENVNIYKRYAFIDNLTGALTRHGYWSELFELLRMAEKLDYNIGVVFADIDSLKKINTELGYKVGDFQIAEVSRTIHKALRKNDMLVRLGGDEFLALLPLRSIKADSLNAVTNRILKFVRENPLLKTTVSLGTQLITPKVVSEILATDDIKTSWEQLIVLSDERIREAKRLGKNQAIS